MANTNIRLTGCGIGTILTINPARIRLDDVTITAEGWKNLVKLREEIADIKSTIDELKVHLFYMPGGPGYVQTKDHFEMLQRGFDTNERETTTTSSPTGLNVL